MTYTWARPLYPTPPWTPSRQSCPSGSTDAEIPADAKGVGGIRLAGLDRRMRERWRTVSALWEENKSPVNKLDLLGQLDYIHKLSAQLEWKQNPGDRPVRVVYNEAVNRRRHCLGR